MKQLDITKAGMMPALGMSAHASTYRTTGASWTERGRSCGLVAAAGTGAFGASVDGSAIPAATDAVPGPDAWSPPIC